jgi:hypothetical protein
MLSWEVDEEHNKPINIFIIGHFDTVELVKLTTGLFNPAYQLALCLDPEAIDAYYTILQDSPLNNKENLTSPLKGDTITF